MTITFSLVMNVLWLIALLVFVAALVYVVMILREIWTSFKITRGMLEKVNTQLDPVLADGTALLGSVNSIAATIANRMKQVLRILDLVSLFTGSESRGDVLKKILPSQKTFQSFLAGLKRGVEVMTEHKSHKKSASTEKPASSGHKEE